MKDLRGISPNAIDKQVTYSASDYIKNDLVNKRAYLVRSAVVNYGDIEIKADSIVFNMATNLVYAVGTKDSTGKVVGKPVFKSGSQEFEADTIWYNFKTKKARIRNIVTKQDEGLLHSSVTKLLEDGTSNIYKSTYSTCDADPPHFYINLKRAKVYPGKKIISGPGTLYLKEYLYLFFFLSDIFPFRKNLLHRVFLSQKSDRKWHADILLPRVDITLRLVTILTWLCVVTFMQMAHGWQLLQQTITSSINTTGIFPSVMPIISPVIKDYLITLNHPITGLAGHIIKMPKHGRVQDSRQM